MDDLSYKCGEANNFFDNSDMQGSLLKSLPIRSKPFLKISSEKIYAFEPNFSFEVIYRAIYLGIIKRKPDYKKNWNHIQCRISEESVLKIFSHQFKGAIIYSNVYYSIGKGKRSECDIIIILDDVLLLLEVKAGKFTLASPSDNFEKHIDSLDDLLFKPYDQAKKFIEYASSKDVISIMNAKNIKIAELKLNSFRKIIPIGITLENVSFYGGVLKNLTKTPPILKKYPFMFMSIDNLFVLRDCFKETSELIHYLETRQLVEFEKKINLTDEMDYIGAYIKHNRLDLLFKRVVDDYGDFDGLYFEGIDDEIDKYYQKLMHNKSLLSYYPRQEYPKELVKILDWLESNRPKNGWMLVVILEI